MAKGKIQRTIQFTDDTDKMLTELSKTLDEENISFVVREAIRHFHQVRVKGLDPES
jgi:predicted transcriptional regulator